MTKRRFQRVVFQPKTYRGMQEGIDKMVGAVSPTLGPLPRVVAIDRTIPNKAPELLDDGATIVRRIIELPDRDADMGAMFLRHVLWQVHEEVGDGAATTAVLFKAVYDEGVRYIIAGGNAMRLRHYLGRGVRVVLDELDRMARPLEGKKKLAQMAESICYDEPLARMLGEIFDIIGEYGQLEVRSGKGRELERQYVEGMYWSSGIVSRNMITDHVELKAEVQNPAVIISDLDVEDPREVVRVLELVLQAEIPGLVILARKISEVVTGLLVAASQKHDDFHAFATKVPGGTATDQAAAMEDIAILLGGNRLVRAAGDTLDRLTLDDLGRARRAWANRHHLGIVGGKGDPRVLRQHIANLRTAFENAKDAEVRKKLQERIGKLLGGSATLFVGGSTETELEARKELAKRTADAMRGAVRKGVVPGGGVSLLACQPALREQLAKSTDEDQAAAYRMLIKALEIPTRTILTNAGYDASEMMAEIRHAGSGYGFDVRTGTVRDMGEAGIWDATAVLKTSVYSALASAALALTTDVLVHHKERREEMKP
jgi:chaperonin GroEL